MNIQTHAYTLKAKSKFKKGDAPRTLEALYQATEDEQFKHKLALVYGTMTTKPAVKNNPLAWVATASDPKCDSNRFDKLVVGKGYAMGCDGYRVHAYKLPESQAAALDGKYIDASGNVLAIETSSNKRLPVDQILKMAVEAEYALSDTFDVSKCVIAKADHGPVEFFDVELFGQKCRFNKKKIEQALNGRQSVKVCAPTGFTGQEPARFLLSDTETAIVMPVRFVR